MNAAWALFALIWHLIVHSSLAVDTDNLAYTQNLRHDAPEPASGTPWQTNWARTGIGGALVGAATLAASSSTPRNRKRAARRQRANLTDNTLPSHDQQPNAARTTTANGAASASN